MDTNFITTIILMLWVDLMQNQNLVGAVAGVSLLVAAVLGGDFLKNKVELEKSESDRLRSYRLSERS